jgi:hypothetical protein
LKAGIVKESSMLTLAEAVKTGRLQDFIAQEEARGVGPIHRANFDVLLKNAATTRQVKHRVPHLTVVRPESELAKVSVHPLRADSDWAHAG